LPESSFRQYLFHRRVQNPGKSFYFASVKNYFFFSLFVLCGNLVSGQIGGQHTYSFLDLPNSARILSLGGSNVSMRDDDINMGYQNPALLNSSMNKRAALTWIDYYAGINYGNAAYGFDVRNYGTGSLSMQHVNYGTFQRADNTGNITGEFNAGEYCLTAGFGRRVDSLFSVGVNIKTIFSSLDTYNSFGMAVDLGASYKSKDKLFEVGAVMRNFGYQFDTYVEGNRESLPFQFQMGLTKGFKYVPLKFSLVATNLQQPDLTYKDPARPEQSIDPLTGDTVIDKINLGNKIMRHAIAGVEFNISKSISFRLGYNYQRRQELKVDTRLKTVGISWGLGIKIYKFSLAYARSAYHLAGSPNQITVSAKLSEFYKKQ